MPELDDAALERRLRGVLQEHLGALPLDLTVETLDRRREAKGVARRSARGRGITLLAAAALLIVGGALAAGSGLLRLPTVVPPVPEPSVVAIATASPEATSPDPSESAAPSASPDPNECAVPTGDPSAPIGPLAWTPASLKEDWPEPVRPELAGGGSVQPMPLTYRDPTRDHGSTSFPCADIRGVMADTSEVRLKLDSGQLIADPTEQWIAYGVVTDDDRDGVPDWRYGSDNTPAVALADGAPGDSRARWWRTNLHTGRTDWGQVGPWTTREWFAADFKSEYPIGPDADFLFRGSNETAGKGRVPWGFELDMPFYTWASVIVNGRVVATDYAPDSGWLVATPGVTLPPQEEPKFPGGIYPLEVGYDNTGSSLSRPLSLSMTVPDKWTVGGPWGVGDISLGFGVVGHAWDGCSEEFEPKLGPSFDDLVTYLADLPLIDISESTDVTIDAYRGRYLRYTTADKELKCFSGSPFPSSPDSEAWILDIDGVRLVIASGSDETRSESVESEVRQIVESINIIGVSPSYSSPATPSPTPESPLLPPADGPVPPNARKWTVTVENESSQPATMFVAEGEEGVLRLVGSATPNVVPAGATMKVTFLFPAKGPDDGWITVNPRLGEGADVGSVGADNIGMPGKIRITAECGGCWVGPAQ